MTSSAKKPGDNQHENPSVVQLALFQTAFQPPFAATKKANSRCRRRIFGAHRRKAGIYIIREDERIVYVGMSQSCVVEALYRHFYRWSNDKTRQTRFPRVTYAHRLSSHAYDCCILFTERADAPKLERGIILSINPRDNRERYQKYLDEIATPKPAQVAAVSPDDDLPF